MKKVILFLLASTMLFFSNCTKTGPQGPQGPQGNANVIGTGSFTVGGTPSTAWTLNTADQWYSADFVSNDITSDIVSTGSVELFVYDQADDSWTNLPYTVNNYTVISFNFYVRGFTIKVRATDNNGAPQYPGSLTFRAVIISSSLRQANPNTNWKNYNEAMAAINSTKTVAPVTQ